MEHIAAWLGFISVQHAHSQPSLFCGTAGALATDALGWGVAPKKNPPAGTANPPPAAGVNDAFSENEATAAGSLLPFSRRAGSRSPSSSSASFAPFPLLGFSPSSFLCSSSSSLSPSVLVTSFGDSTVSSFFCLLIWCPLLVPPPFQRRTLVPEAGQVMEPRVATLEPMARPFFSHAQTVLWQVLQRVLFECPCPCLPPRGP